MVVGVAGNVDHDEVVALVRASFARSGFLGAPGSAPAAAPEPATRARSGRFRRAAAGDVRVTRPFEQVNLVLGVNALARGDDRRYALGVLNACLGGGPSSRLFQEVRERRGLAYSVYSYAGHYADAGIFCVGAGCLPGKLDQVLDVVRAELRLLAEHGHHRRGARARQGPAPRRAGARPRGLRRPDVAHREVRAARRGAAEHRGDHPARRRRHPRRRPRPRAHAVLAARRPSPSSARRRGSRARRSADAATHGTAAPRREPGVARCVPPACDPRCGRPRATPVRASTLSVLALLAALTGCGSASEPTPDVIVATPGPSAQVAADARRRALDCDRRSRPHRGGRLRRRRARDRAGRPGGRGPEPAAGELRRGAGRGLRRGGPDRDPGARDLRGGRRGEGRLRGRGRRHRLGRQRRLGRDVVRDLRPRRDAAGDQRRRRHRGVDRRGRGRRCPPRGCSRPPGRSTATGRTSPSSRSGDWRDGQQYLRDVDGELARSTRTTYAEQVPLPADATDTGWRRDGRALWLVPDRSAAYLVDRRRPRGSDGGRAVAGREGAGRLHVTARGATGAAIGSGRDSGAEGRRARRSGQGRPRGLRRRRGGRRPGAGGAHRRRRRPGRPGLRRRRGGRRLHPPRRRHGQPRLLHRARHPRRGRHHRLRRRPARHAALAARRAGRASGSSSRRTSRSAPC